MGLGGGMLTASKSRSWSAMLQRGGGLMDRLAGSVTPVGRTALLKQALEARERGNIAAAFWLLDEAYGQSPEHMEVCAAFWDVAVEYANQQAAVPAVLHLIAVHASAGESELARQYWCELIAFDPDALASPITLSRILPCLVERAEAASQAGEADTREGRALLCALRAIVSEQNEGLTSGIAYRVAEIARSIDRETALRAARLGSEADDLHEVKRERLKEWARELEADDVIDALMVEPVAETGAEIDAPEPDPLPLLEPEPIEDDESLRVRTMQGEITGLDPEQVVLSVCDGRQVKIDFAAIEAVAVAEIERDEGAHIFVADFVLGLDERDALRTVRVRASELEALTTLADGQQIPVRDLVAIILNRSKARALPDDDALLTDSFERFDSFRSYREWLSYWGRESLR
jgi:hypothetical protein